MQVRPALEELIEYCDIDLMRPAMRAELLQALALLRWDQHLDDFSSIGAYERCPPPLPASPSSSSLCPRTGRVFVHSLRHGIGAVPLYLRDCSAFGGSPVLCLRQS